MPTINLPTIELRPYQVPAWKAFEGGASRVATVWPRRGGKDSISLQALAVGAIQTVGNYWHLMPEATQVRKAMWEGIAGDGSRHIDRAFPLEIRENTNNSEMFIKLKNGSTIQFGGSDRYDSLVGNNPRGVVFSEYAISNPKAYSFVRPILAENGGFAMFPFTPRGRNHGKELFDNLSADSNSFAELLTCDDTQHISAEALALERAEMSEELFLQEYYGSWDFGQEGSIYARYMNRAEVDGRICDIAYDHSLPVHVSLDLGKTDSTALWFFQVRADGWIHWLDYEEGSGLEVKDYADIVNDKPYTIGTLIMPHDGKQKRLGMTRTVTEQFEDLRFDVTQLDVESSTQIGIERCRVALSKSRFNREETTQGRSALSNYRYEIDDKKEVKKLTPLHDWASDGSDSFRYAVQAIDLGACDATTFGPAGYDTSHLHRAAL